MVFQFKIQIKDISHPAVWRTVVVPASFSFLRFHKVIQTAFGWEGYHLFEFTDKKPKSNICISAPQEVDFFEPGTQDASKVRLSDVFKGNKRQFFYTYDFGDNRVHEISLESKMDDTRKKAVCLSGKGARPAEDCGGIYGYEEIKDIFKTMPDSDQVDEYREWLGLEEGGAWDAEALDIDGINKYLKQV